MRAAFRLPFITGMLVILAVAIVGYQKHAAEADIQELDDQLKATRIDITCEKMPPPDALKLLLQKLAEKNAYFKNCTFQLDFAYPPPPDPVFPDYQAPLVTLDVKDVAGYETMKYVEQLSGIYCGFRPRMVVFVAVGAVNPNPSLQYRTRSERVYDAAADAFYEAKHAFMSMLGLDP